jgi:hypothetical protein
VDATYGMAAWASAKPCAEISKSRNSFTDLPARQYLYKRYRMVLFMQSFRQRSGWAENACIEERIEPLSPDKLRDTVSPSRRGTT